MADLDLDALEKLLVTEAADPFAFVEAAPALLAMARRMEEAEKHCEAWRMTAATGERTIERLTGERNEARDERDLLRSESAGLLRDLSVALGAGVAEDLVALAAQRVRERDEARAALAEARASTRPRLDPAHVAALLGMRREAALRLARAETDDSTPEWVIVECRAQVSALEAVLGEETRGQALSDVGTTERA